jgi:hypothetical protein
MAAMRREVPTGRRMNGVEMLMPGCLTCERGDPKREAKAKPSRKDA